VLAIGLGLCTIVFCYARSPYSEALQTFAFLLVVERTFAQGERMTFSGMLLLGVGAGILINAKLVQGAVLPLCVLYLAAMHLGDPGSRDVRGFLRGGAAAALGFVPFVALFAAHNMVKTGSLFSTGYHIEEGLFSGDLIPGLYGFLLSSGKGMFLYSPPLLLGLWGIPSAWRRDRRGTLLLLAIIAVVTIIHSQYRRWHGDYAWGPRYMVPLTPLWLLLALPWLDEALHRGRVHLRRGALALVLACGLAVQALGSAFYWDHYIRILVAVQRQAGMSGWSQEFLPFGYYVPQFSPVWGHAWMLEHYLRNDPQLVKDAPFKTLLTARLDLNENWAAMRLDWWALDWGRDRTSARIAAVLIAVLAAGVMLSARSLYERAEWLRQVE
jgi:hypothetical protein